MVHVSAALKTRLPVRLKLPRPVQALLLAALLYCLPPRPARAEEFAESKVMYYQEDNNRMTVLAPAVLYQKEFSPNFGIKIDGIYNSISGATPTGAPPARRTVTTVTTPAVTTTTTTTTPTATRPSGGDDDGDDDDGERESEADRPSLFGRQPRGFHARVGASPAPTTPAPSSSTTTTRPSSGSSSGAETSTTTVTDTSVPTSDVSDERVGANLDLYGKVADHRLGAALSGSTERDYNSIGLALRDGIEFNEQNTTLNLGAAYTHDTIDARTANISDTKNTTDLMVGISQYLDAQTILTANVAVGLIEGYLSDPYKVVELNGVLVPEKRPDSKVKRVGYVSLTHLFKPLNGSVEGSYRYYNDNFDITGHTMSLAWIQRLGQPFIVKPMVRYYDQTAADFYAVRFTGSPESYSSDYRLSAFSALGYGMKVVWEASKAWSLDAAYERYVQTGQDGETSDDMYPLANVYILGARYNF